MIVFKVEHILMHVDIFYIKLEVNNWLKALSLLLIDLEESINFASLIKGHLSSLSHNPTFMILYILISSTISRGIMFNNIDSLEKMS